MARNNIFRGLRGQSIFSIFTGPKQIVMQPYETTTESFIVRIWLEHKRTRFNQAVWRGHVTHVASGERRYVKDLDGIIFFIISYLEPLDANPSFSWRARRFWSRVKNLWK